MALGWLLLALCYLSALFWLARWGESPRDLARRITSHPALYSLALAIYCTAWTFFGAVGEASRNTWAYLPIFLGPILLYSFGYPLLYKLILVSKKQHITTIADFIASRYGKRQTVALMVTIIALMATIPYIALQLKAIGAAFLQVSGGQDAQGVILMATLFIALFSIYFGTKRTDVTEFRRGLILAISFESIIKLLALGLLAYTAWELWQNQHSRQVLIHFGDNASMDKLLSFSFISQTLMAAGAVICLPRQFHVAVVDNLKLEHLKTARWLFPLYLALIAVTIPVIAAAGQSLFAGTELEPDNYVLNLALLSDSLILQILVFVGGLSAASAMIIVACLTLSTMVTNDVILPKLLSASSDQTVPPNYSKTILFLRRLVIGVLLCMAYLYQRQLANSTSLASIGWLAFSLVIQLLPAIIGGLYWKRGHAHGVYAGFICGLLTWILWLILPLFGASELHPLANNSISEGAMLSLLVNSLAYVLFSVLAPVRLVDRIQAQAFVVPSDQRLPLPKNPFSNATVGDIKTLLSTFLGPGRWHALLQDYQQRKPFIDLGEDSQPHQDFITFSERALGGVIGAASAKALIDSALSGKKLDFEEVMNFFDDTTQAIQFNMNALFTSLESIEQGISVVDRNLTLVAWNKRYLDLFDYPEGMVQVGTPIERLVRYNAERGECGVGEIEALVQKRLDFMRQGSPHRFIRQRSDGKMIEMVGNPLPGGGFVTSFNDVTEHIEIQQALEEANIDLEKRIRKRTEEVQAINAELRTEIGRRAEAEKEMVRARKAAEAANASKSRFLALASHDVLQPLNAAKLYLSALAEIHLPDNANDIVNKLNDSVNASETLIATLLDIARLEQGELKPKKEPISVLSVLAPLADEYAMKAEQKGLTLKVKLLDCWVNTDKTYLQRIVQNLLSNAVKYTQQGKLLLSVRKQHGRILIQVRDTGTGISPEEQQKIFKDFYRVDGTKEHGVGLGLSVVMRLSQQLGCPIWLRSFKGRGSCFSISLPPAEAKMEVTAPRSIPLSRFSDLDVLCIDDQQENLDALSLLLNKWQLQVETARSWDEALAQVSTKQPQILLVDYHLNEGTNGLDLISEIRNRTHQDLPAVLITASQEPELISQCKDLDVGYLSKPVKPAKLRALLQSLQRQQHKQSA